MKLIFSEKAWDEYLYWQKNDQKILEHVNQLLREIQRTPYSGIGKPEPLKYAFTGYWSRRITNEHRLVYKIQDDAVLIAQLRFHYANS